MTQSIRINGTEFTMSERSYELTCEGAALAQDDRYTVRNTDVIDRTTGEVVGTASDVLGALKQAADLNGVAWGV